MCPFFMQKFFLENSFFYETIFIQEVAEEDMRVRKVGRSYTEVPVRTEFDEQKGAFTWQ